MSTNTAVSKFEVLIKTVPNCAESNLFAKLAPAVEDYITGECDLVALGKQLGGIGRQFLSIHHLSLNPMIGLQRLGCINADILMRRSEYPCGFMRGAPPRSSLVPLGIVTTEGVQGLLKYHAAVDACRMKRITSNVLHCLTDDQRFYEEVLQGPNPETASWGEIVPQYNVSRFEQLFAGSGYTAQMLAAGDTYTELRPVMLALSNGDNLLAYAFKQI